MGWDGQVTECLSPEVSLPAIGQGALGLEGRRDDAFLREVVAALEHPPTRAAVTAERALLDRLEGGCQVPIAAHATLAGDRLRLEGLVASVDGRRIVQDRAEGPVAEAREIGLRLGEQLLRQGGEAILNEIYGRG
jgi:hydroxymethylbilane synthase